MNPVLAGVALAVTVGAVTAISAREARTALVGLAVVLGISPFLSDPLPAVTTLATRVVGGALAAYLLRAAISGAPAVASARPSSTRTARGSAGRPSSCSRRPHGSSGVAVAVGLATLSPSGPATGPTDLLGSLTPAAVATAAGLASIVIAIVPAFAGRDALRTAIGSLVLVQGILLFRVGIAGPPGDLEQLGGVGLLIAIAVAGAWLIGVRSRSRSGRSGATRRIARPTSVAADIDAATAEPPMSVLLVASLAIAGGVVTALLAARRRPAFAIGLDRSRSLRRHGVFDPRRGHRPARRNGHRRLGWPANARAGLGRVHLPVRVSWTRCSATVRTFSGRPSSAWASGRSGCRSPMPGSDWRP